MPEAQTCPDQLARALSWVRTKSQEAPIHRDPTNGQVWWSAPGNRLRYPPRWYGEILEQMIDEDSGLLEFGEPSWANAKGLQVGANVQLTDLGNQILDLALQEHQEQEA